MEEKVLLKGDFEGEKTPLAIGIIFGIISIITSIPLDDELWGDGLYIFLGFVAAAIFIGIGAVVMKLLEKRELVITNKRVIARRCFGFRRDIKLEDITDISMYNWNPRYLWLSNGISVASPSARIGFVWCSNKEAIYNTIAFQILN